MTEQHPSPTRAPLPPGILSAELYREHYPIDRDTLPWLQEPYTATIVHCEVSDGADFLLASVVGSHPRLIRAAEALTTHQSNIVNNMLYSRLSAFAQHGSAVRTIDTMPNPATPFPIHVLRNSGGQRAYFGAPLLPVGMNGALVPVVLKLGVCDKNQQAEVMKVLSGATDRAKRMRSGR